MTEKADLSEVQTKIRQVENKIADTHYFIENALCQETIQMYRCTLAEQTNELTALYKMEEKLLEMSSACN